MMSEASETEREREFWMNIRNGLNTINAALQKRARERKASALLMVALMVEAASNVIAIHYHLRKAQSE